MVITSMYSRVVGSLLLASMVALVLASSTPSAMAYKGMAKSYNFNTDAMEWQWNSRNCLAMNIENFPDVNYRQRYLWTEFCGDLGPYTGTCGCLKCLQVTNPAAGDDDVSVMLRIIDICDKSIDGSTVLYMDTDAFNQINSDGDPNGQLEVNYVEVTCEDDG